MKFSKLVECLTELASIFLSVRRVVRLFMSIDWSLRVFCIRIDWQPLDIWCLLICPLNQRGVQKERMI